MPKNNQTPTKERRRVRIIYRTIIKLNYPMKEMKIFININFVYE